ncbi:MULTISPECIES: hypothetical protein [Aerococcus]|uniref:hypothetical protein n=1 Tax=Aerococcus TaxID=1375 RepID=UPI000DCD9230|nr:hypothetical protein [Aerococcus urinae]RAV71468.1 hypothetical protein DBT40_03940 [Aerococcus urinae]RAW05175.1 hypothetical protein DBT41_04895 [Aerococcus urinae]
MIISEPVAKKDVSYNRYLYQLKVDTDPFIANWWDKYIDELNNRLILGMFSMRIRQSAGGRSLVGIYIVKSNSCCGSSS